MTMSKKEKQKVMKNINYSGKYAMGDLWFGKKLNLFLFNEMDKKGYDLMGISFGESVFKKRNSDNKSIKKVK